jgi:ankyrin repeat protein
LLESLTEVADDMSQAATETGESEAELQEIQAEVSQLPEVTALHLAASMGLAKVAAMLLKETPNIDAVDENGNTALAVAIERGFEKAVEFLVISGACVGLGHQHGREVFLLITERDWNTVAESIANKAKAIVLENGSNQVSLLQATYYGDNSSTRTVLKQADIDLQAEDRDLGITALFVAVERGHREIMEILLSAGVSVDSRDSAGCTSLHRATRRKNEPMMRFLLRNKAAVDAKNDSGLTAFSANFRTCGDSCARILLDAGADPNTGSHDGVSELYEVAAKGEVQYVKKLLKYGTNPSITTRYGWRRYTGLRTAGTLKL